MNNRGMSGRVIAGCFALAAFAVAILAGLASENPASSVLARALMAMLMCYPVGMIVGMVCERVILAHVEAHRTANPAPDSSVPSIVAPVANGIELSRAAGEEPVIVV